MKADLAPKKLFVYYLLTVGLGLIIVSIIHQFAMNIAIHSDNYVPFITTTSIWGIFFVMTLFLFNKCRYLISIPTDEKHFKMGNLLINSQVTADKIKVDKKVFLNLFKVNIEDKGYYIFSSDKTVDEFKNNKS